MVAEILLASLTKKELRDYCNGAHCSKNRCEQSMITESVAQTALNSFRRMALARRETRLAMVLSVDVSAGLAATVAAYWLRLGQLPDANLNLLKFGLIALVAWIIAAVQLQVYKSMIRHSGSRTIIDLIGAAALQAALLSVVVLVLPLPGVPRTLAGIQPMVNLGFVSAARLLARYLLVEADIGKRHASSPRRLLIYGAGEAGRRLGAALANHRGLKLQAYIDDARGLTGRRLEGVRVYGPDAVGSLIERYGIDEVMLAIPGAPKARRKEIVSSLAMQQVRVSTLPDLGQLLHGNLSLADVHQVDVVELLGRDPVDPDRGLLAAVVTGRSVLITGAGGSIGSELAQQILRLKPLQIIVVDLSEFALFSIDKALREFVAASPELGLAEVEIVPELANCASLVVMERLFSRYRPQTVFHAAAYKHVPLLEQNPVVGAGNNVFATLYTAQMAERFGAERFIQVSTDKAVRPTSLMGTTKRICELILQALQQRGSKTVFSMVRFGNVLGSSGSVVPIFRKQIAEGGPVTITDRGMTRYFMTIPEAAQLVIQAGGMATGGEVFLLDMGDPVRIVDLAEAMIRLHGKTVRSREFPSGDIEIREVGLRPGEKLYEELLIDSAAEPTSHPGIFRARESALPWSKIEPLIERLRLAVEQGDSSQVRAVLGALVPEAGESEGDVDASSTSPLRKNARARRAGNAAVTG